MSLTSYRAAPPRVMTISTLPLYLKLGPRLRGGAAVAKAHIRSPSLAAVMSLTSYRAAPPRVMTISTLPLYLKLGPRLRGGAAAAKAHFIRPRRAAVLHPASEGARI